MHSWTELGFVHTYKVQCEAAGTGFHAPTTDVWQRTATSHFCAFTSGKLWRTLLLDYDNLTPAIAAVRQGPLKFGNKCNYFAIQWWPISEFFLGFPTISRFVLLLEASCKWSRVWNTGGKIMTGGNQGIRRKPCPKVTLCTISHMAQTAIETGQLL